MKELVLYMSYAKLGRRSDHRRALLRNQVTSLLANERIVTTEAKAKEINALAEKMITIAKQGDLHARRQLLSFLQDEAVVKKAFETLAPRYAEKKGGYTRIIKKGARRGDAAPMALIELV